jgi:hypothetical protein
MNETSLLLGRIQSLPVAMTRVRFQAFAAALSSAVGSSPGNANGHFCILQAVVAAFSDLTDKSAS